MKSQTTAGNEFLKIAKGLGIILQFVFLLLCLIIGLVIGGNNSWLDWLAFVLFIFSISPLWALKMPSKKILLSILGSQFICFSLVLFWASDFSASLRPEKEYNFYDPDEASAASLEASIQEGAAKLAEDADEKAEAEKKRQAEEEEKAKELSLELERKKCEKAFKTFSSQRFFKELNCDDPKSLDGVFQIDNSLFKLIPYQQKKDLGKLTYECCGEKNIKFVDYYSGRTVATYTYFSGFKLKD